MSYQCAYSISKTKVTVLRVSHYCSYLAPDVQKVDSAIHRINHYPADNTVGFANAYPLDSDLSGG